MVDGVMLLVDAAEGCLPQTRFVLRKALEAQLAGIAVVNKIDRQDASPEEVVERNLRTVPRSRCYRRSNRVSHPVFDLARRHCKERTLPMKAKTCNRCLSKSSLPFPHRAQLREDSLQLLVANLDYSEFVGRLAIGRIFSGAIALEIRSRRGQADGSIRKVRVSQLYAFEGLNEIHRTSRVWRDRCAWPALKILK